MSEYVFRDAGSFGCDMDEQMDGLPMTVREYFAEENTDHYGTIHEEIVRCRDCVKSDESKVYERLFCHRFSMCDGAGFPVEPDGFCKWSEKKGVDG